MENEEKINSEIIKKALVETSPKKRYLYNALMAFLCGGTIYRPSITIYI